ncbi:hypothetical protein JL721_1387 [Aureococcus anophagefferens]|nr:hypothetical protein JL721_1387 [Aureococcus anophagefferens]
MLGLPPSCYTANGAPLCFDVPTTALLLGVAVAMWRASGDAQGAPKATPLRVGIGVAALCAATCDLVLGIDAFLIARHDFARPHSDAPPPLAPSSPARLRYVPSPAGTGVTPLAAGRDTRRPVLRALGFSVLGDRPLYELEVTPPGFGAEPRVVKRFEFHLDLCDALLRQSLAAPTPPRAASLDAGATPPKSFGDLSLAASRRAALANALLAAPEEPGDADLTAPEPAVPEDDGPGPPPTLLGGGAVSADVDAVAVCAVAKIADSFRETYGTLASGRVLYRVRVFEDGELKRTCAKSFAQLRALAGLVGRAAPEPDGARSSAARRRRRLVPAGPALRWGHDPDAVPDANAALGFALAAPAFAETVRLFLESDVVAGGADRWDLVAAVDDAGAVTATWATCAAADDARRRGAAARSLALDNAAPALNWLPRRRPFELGGASPTRQSIKQGILSLKDGVLDLVISDKAPRPGHGARARGGASPRACRRRHSARAARRAASVDDADGDDDDGRPSDLAPAEAPAASRRPSDAAPRGGLHVADGSTGGCWVSLARYRNALLHTSAWRDFRAVVGRLRSCEPLAEREPGAPARAATLLNLHGALAVHGALAAGAGSGRPTSTQRCRDHDRYALAPGDDDEHVALGHLEDAACGLRAQLIAANLGDSLYDDDGDSRGSLASARGADDRGGVRESLASAFDQAGDDGSDPGRRRGARPATTTRSRGSLGDGDATFGVTVVLPHDFQRHACRRLQEESEAARVGAARRERAGLREFVDDSDGDGARRSGDDDASSSSSSEGGVGRSGRPRRRRAASSAAAMRNLLDFLASTGGRATAKALDDPRTTTTRVRFRRADFRPALRVFDAKAAA